MGIFASYREPRINTNGHELFSWWSVEPTSEDQERLPFSSLMVADNEFFLNPTRGDCHVFLENIRVNSRSFVVPLNAPFLAPPTFGFSSISLLRDVLSFTAIPAVKILQSKICNPKSSPPTAASGRPCSHTNIR